MTVFFSNVIPLLGSFFSVFPVIPFIALGVVCCIPTIIKEIVSYV